jgi:hypothetical protein
MRAGVCCLQTSFLRQLAPLVTCQVVTLTASPLSIPRGFSKANVDAVSGSSGGGQTGLGGGEVPAFRCVVCMTLVLKRCCLGLCLVDSLVPQASSWFLANVDLMAKAMTPAFWDGVAEGDEQVHLARSPSLRSEVGSYKVRWVAVHSTPPHALHGLLV